MANWIICDYYGASINSSLPNKGLPINENPVNLDMCETFKRYNAHSLGTHHLIFLFQKNEPVIWEFINKELRDLEFNRAIELIKTK